MTKLNRRQELALIELGMQALLDKIATPKPRGPYNKKPLKSAWSEARRAKFAATMKKKYADKKKHAQ